MADLDSSSEDPQEVEEEESKDNFYRGGPSQGGIQSAGPETCKVCYGADADAAFIPCGHVTACIKCAQRCNMCPVCRTPYHDIMKLYRQ